jgi:methylated-DNA-[protein]-cysteine S-methyltransferase
MHRASATARFASPLGSLTLAATQDRLLGLSIPHTVDTGATQGDVTHPVLAETIAQLDAWFTGRLRDFDLPLAPTESPEGATLRAAIASIPYGKTMTYGDLAATCGSVARAVGQACKTNPFPLIIPCHRVTSAAGPEYYSGGNGPRTKSWLLDFEYSNLPADLRTRLL